MYRMWLRREKITFFQILFTLLDKFLKNVVVILPKFVIIKVGKDEGYGKKNK